MSPAIRQLVIACRTTIILIILAGLAYPLLLVSLSGLLFPSQAHGTLIARDSRIVGSKLVGQNFTSRKYFHARPSAAGDKGYDARSSGGSNIAPTNAALIDAVRQRLKIILEENPGISAQHVPVDLVTASGSGLDPEISPAAAELQVSRVAKARGMSEAQVRELVKRNTRPRWAGVLGEPGVNVLMLNLALDDATAKKSAR
jgi:K+-transporting ATPase ATPase C chain